MFRSYLNIISDDKKDNQNNIQRTTNKSDCTSYRHFISNKIYENRIQVPFVPHITVMNTFNIMVSISLLINA